MTKKCVICGNEFEAGRGSKRYCGEECRKKANLKFNKENYRMKRSRKKNADGFNADDRLAKEMGVSYGKLQAMRYAGKI